MDSRNLPDEKLVPHDHRIFAGFEDFDVGLHLNLQNLNLTAIVMENTLSASLTARELRLGYASHSPPAKGTQAALEPHLPGYSPRPFPQ